MAKKRVTLTNTNVLAGGEIADGEMVITWNFPKGYTIPPGGNLELIVEELPEETKDDDED